MSDDIRLMFVLHERGLPQVMGIWDDMNDIDGGLYMDGFLMGFKDGIYSWRILMGSLGFTVVILWLCIVFASCNIWHVCFVLFSFASYECFVLHIPYDANEKYSKAPLRSCAWRCSTIV